MNTAMKELATKESMILNKLSFSLVALLLLLFIAGCIGSYAYLQQMQAVNRLAEALEIEQRRNSELSETLQYLTDEIADLHEQMQKITLEQALETKTPAGGSGATAYLTIDDGPSENTIKMLQILADYKIPATFFVTGRNSSGDEQIYRRILEEGHALGNHTYTHNLKTIYRSADTFIEDLLRLEELLFRQTGLRPDIIRFPGGSSNTVAAGKVMQQLTAALPGLGYDYFDWNVAPGDGTANLPPHQLIENTIAQADRLRGRDIVVLLHDHYLSHNTVTALPQIIEALQARGYDFATLKKGAIHMKHR